MPAIAIKKIFFIITSSGKKNISARALKDLLRRSYKKIGGYKAAPPRASFKLAMGSEQLAGNAVALPISN
jgi:hypothetical protein